MSHRPVSTVSVIAQMVLHVLSWGCCICMLASLIAMKVYMGELVVIGIASGIWTMFIDGLEFYALWQDLVQPLPRRNSFPHNFSPLYELATTGLCVGSFAYMTQLGRNSFDDCVKATGCDNTNDANCKIFREACWELYRGYKYAGDPYRLVAMSLQGFIGLFHFALFGVTGAHCYMARRP